MGMNTVYEKLIRMAKEEAQGRQQVNLKELCNKLSSRFRLSNKDIFNVLKEAPQSNLKIGHNTLKFNGRA
jgi:hypothetical protein